MSIYDYKVKTQDGEKSPWTVIKGKDITDRKYGNRMRLYTTIFRIAGEIYDEFHDQGLEILDFPCNQFANQAPGDDNEIHDFLHRKIWNLIPAIFQS